MGMSAEGTRRQHVEAALSESELRFQAIFAQAAVGIAQIGLDGAWLLVNNRFCQMLGYSEAELCTKALEDITHPDYIEESRAGRRRLLAGEISSHTMEKRYIRKDGTIFWGRLNRSLVRDHDNRPRYLIAVVEDMTERIEAERALRVSEQRLALAQNAGHVGVWDCDLRTNITVISPEYAKLHGLGPDHPPLTNQEWLELVHPDDRERVQALLRESLVHPHSWDTEFRVVWPDGSVHWLLGKGKVFLDDCGLPVRMAGVSLEITDRKQAEAALRESEERFRNMADTAPVMIWVSGTDKLCTFLSKPWLDFTGRTMEQELRNGWAEGVHPEDLDRCLATYNSSFDARRSFRMEYRIQRADGEYRWVLDNGTPHYRDGEFMGFIGSCIDVTEQKLMANRLHGQTVQLKDAQRLAKLGSWERDLKNGSIDWSEETLRIFNVSSLPSTLPDFLKHVHPNDREKVLKAAEEVQSSISPIELPYRIIRPDGEVRFVRAIVETIRDDQGVAVRTIEPIRILPNRLRRSNFCARAKSS